jgi:hypothetical protein
MRDHFYTISESERHNAIVSFSYVLEGVACYVFGTESTGAVPLFRLRKGDHFYTTSQTERDAAIAQFGYISEGIACYVFAEATGTVPLYRLTTQDSRLSRLYTVSLDERDKAIKDYSYVSDGGLACQVFGWQAPGTVPLFRLRGGVRHEHSVLPNVQSAAAWHILRPVPGGIYRSAMMWKGSSKAFPCFQEAATIMQKTRAVISKPLAASLLRAGWI